MFAAIPIIVMLIVLWAPSWVVLFRLKRFTLAQAILTAWPVWVAQVIIALALIILADREGMLNPALYIFVTCAFVGFAGAVFLRRRLKRDQT